MPDSPDLEPLFRTILDTIPAPVVRRGGAAAGPRHQPRRLAVPGPAGAGPGPPGPPARRARTWPGSSATAPSRTVKITELLITEGLERKPGEQAGAGRHLRRRRHPRDHHRRDPRRSGEPRRTAADPRRRAGHLDDHRHQHLAARRPREGLQGHRPAGQGPSRQRAGRQRVAPHPSDRAPRRLGGAGPRRAGAGDPGRADAPRGLRAHRRQAAGRDPRDRRQGARAGRAAHHRRTRGVPRHHHRAAGHPQGPDGADDQPRHRLGPDGVPRAGPRPDRLPDRVPHRHPRHRHRPPHLRGLRAVGRRDPLAQQRQRWWPTARVPPRRTR